jgi:hypothetical protein
VVVVFHADLSPSITVLDESSHSVVKSKITEDTICYWLLRACNGPQPKTAKLLLVVVLSRLERSPVGIYNGQDDIPHNWLKSG